MDAFETISSYCFAPLQNRPWADRALIVVSPDEYTALILIRKENRLEAYSTLHAEEKRRNAGKRYSLRILEDLLLNTSALSDALAQFAPP